MAHGIFNLGCDMRTLELRPVGSSSLARDRTPASCSGSVESQPLDHQERSQSLLFLTRESFRQGHNYLNVDAYCILKGILINLCMRTRWVCTGCHLLPCPTRTKQLHNLWSCLSIVVFCCKKFYNNHTLICRIFIVHMIQTGCEGSQQIIRCDFHP